MFKICNHINCKSSFIIYLLECYISVTFNMLINQKHHSTLGSITTEKMSKIPMQYQIVIISSSTIMNLTTRKFIIIDQLRNIRTPSNEGLKKKQKTWDFSTTWSDPRPKLKPCDADVSAATIIFRFCIWSKKTDVSHHILQHLYITNSSYLLRKTTAETSWENSSFLLVF